MFFRAAKRPILNRLSRLPYALFSNRKVQVLTSFYLLHRADKFDNDFFHDNQAYEHVDQSTAWIHSREKLRTIGEVIYQKTELSDKDISIFQTILKHADEISLDNFQSFLNHVGVEKCDEFAITATRT